VGSGLAHRSAAWVRALSAVGDVSTLVVPVVDPGARVGAADAHVVALPSGDEVRAGAIRGMAVPAVRTAMATFDSGSGGVPLAAAAPPWLGAEAARHFAQAPPFDVVVCFRAYLAPFVVGLRASSPAVAAARLVVDLDDDDAAFHHASGNAALAAAYERLYGRLRMHAETRFVAAGVHALPGVVVLPNCVDLPADVSPPPASGPILFVGNLTYGPNVDGLEWYLRSAHPLLLASGRHPMVRIVGRGGERFGDTAGVDVAGLVADLGPEYAASTVAIAPIRVGSGTRIKVLEAWAHGRPVVATSAALEGLTFQPGLHALVADSPTAFAEAVNAVLCDPSMAAAVGAAGRALVEQRYAATVFDSLVAGLVANG